MYYLKSVNIVYKKTKKQVIRSKYVRPSINNTDGVNISVLLLLTNQIKVFLKICSLYLSLVLSYLNVIL
jgi:hypothetical protein